jgi:hypothetical protein
MMKRWKIALVMVCLFAAAPCAARAADPALSGTLSLVVENDLFSNIDRHYTNGVKLVYVPDPEVSAPRWAARVAHLVPWFPEQGQIRHSYTFGQSMFTPSDITIDAPALDERPYAGWLYAALGLGVRSGRQLDQLTLNIGVVGPASLAEQSQKLVHKVIDSDDPQGWDTQLHNEPGLVVTYQRSWREFATTTLFGAQLDLTPHIGVALGNVFTYANAGVTLRYGLRLPDDFGPPRIQPGPQGSGHFSTASGLGWYLFAGIDGRAVARNIFLDGNTFRDSRSVDKDPWVGDLQFGLVLEWSALRLSYTHVLRTREFHTQENKDSFGAISVSFKH